MPTTLIRNILRYNIVKQEFEDVGESITEDISVIRILFTRDVHFNAYDLEIGIYGQDCDEDSIPIVYSQYSGDSVILDVNISGSGAGVAPYQVLEFFDQELLALFVKMGIKIHWNQGDYTYKEIDPVQQKNIGLLFAQDQ